jgi:hypothetical protein
MPGYLQKRGRSVVKVLHSTCKDQALPLAGRAGYEEVREHLQAGHNDQGRGSHSSLKP